ncbi:DUF4190 domain-containing protein [Streptomyces sp. NPDC057854]|uniref:DUF4190 domain-containing protein n=1 Tax=unclassified Streptomyces TaxID=2593676 RepID=UPI0036C80D9D
MEPTQPPQPPSGPYGAPGPYPAPGPYTSPGMPYAGPYGPYGPPPAAPTTNGLAIGSLVSGIVCCLPPLGLVLGVFALRQIGKRGQNGKGLAVAGVVLSSLSTLLVIIGLITGQVQAGVREFSEGMREAAATRSPVELRTGACFVDDSADERYSRGVRTVDCAEPHDGEVTGRFEATTSDTWPGEKELERIGEERCDTMAAEYALDTWSLGPETMSLYYYPDRSAWREGERRIACGIGGEERTRGSLRSDRTTLTPDQLAFLTQVNPIEDAVYEEPGDDQADDLEAHRAWAAGVRAAVDSARTGLRGRVWEKDAQAEVDAYLASLGRASQQWAKLAGAKDADAFWAEYDRAWELLPEDGSAGVRGALDLTATPPETPGGTGSA